MTQSLPWWRRQLADRRFAQGELTSVAWRAEREAYAAIQCLLTAPSVD